MSFTQYLGRFKYHWLLVFLFNILCHGSMLLGNTVGIDTEAIIVAKDELYEGWLNTGRAGLVLLKYLFDSTTFNPYLAGAGAIFFLTVTCVLWTYLFYRITGKENGLGILIFSGIVSAHTVLTEQMYFKLQAMEIAVCFCLIGVAVYLAHQFALRKKWWYFIVSLPLSIVAFSCYQAMNAVWLLGAVACFFLYYYFRCPEGNASGRQMWSYIVRVAGCFLAGFGLNQLAVVLFFSESSYLDTLSLWGTTSFTECLLNIGKHMAKVLLGTRIYYAGTFALYVAALVVLCSLVLLGDQKRRSRYLGVIVLCLLFLSPFFLSVVCGGETVIRSQLVLPFTLAFMGYAVFLFDISKCRHSRLLRVGWGVLGVLTISMQMRYTLLLNHTDNVRYQSDVRLATSIMEEIDKLQDEENSYSLVFVGSREAQLDPSCIKGESIGYSFFDWDTDVEPRGYYSTRRIVGFMNTMGAGYTWATEAEVTEAVEASEDMDCWPADESVRLVGDVIVVKLSDFD